MPGVATWSEQDTEPARAEAALRDLWAERLAESRAFVPARVLNLIVIVDANAREGIDERVRRVGSAASRTVVCFLDPERTTLDATVQLMVDQAEPTPGVLAIGRERISLEIGPAHVETLDTVVDPLLVSDLTTVIWSPHGHPEAVDALRRLAQTVLIDSHDTPDLAGSFRRAGALAEDLYVVDLAWLRSTPWRERTAAAFDGARMRGALSEIASITVRHHIESDASAVLFCAWLASRLGWEPGTPFTRADGRMRGTAISERGEVELLLWEDPELNTPGLAGVTIETVSGALVGLDRGAGGLRATRRAAPGAPEISWTVLGASRGESGILGEGVRQALLRDPAYRAALVAARSMTAA